MRKSDTPLSFLYETQHNFPARVTTLAQDVGLAYLAQRQHGLNHRLDVTCVYQFGNLPKLRGVGLHEYVSRA